MRAKLARGIVRWASSAWLCAMRCNDDPDRRDEELWWRETARWREKYGFPVARWLDREAMTDQMVEECWWG